MRHVGWVGLALAVVIMVGRAEAQVPIVPVPLKKGDSEKVTVPAAPIENPATGQREHPVGVLTSLYNSGQGERLVKLAVELLETWSCDTGFFELSSRARCGTDPQPRSRFDLGRDYVLLSWVGTDYAGKRVVYRAGIHKGWKDPYTVTLPGLRARSQAVGTATALGRAKPDVYEVFISPIESAEHDSQYVFTEKANANEGSVQPFLSAALGPMFSSVSRLAGGVNALHVMGNANRTPGLEAGMKAADVEPTVTIQVGRLAPPLPRAEVKVKAMVKQPPPAGEFVEKAEKLASRLTLVEARDSQCAIRLAAALVSTSQRVAFGDTLAGSVCLTGTSAACLARFDRAFDQARTDEETACAAEIKASIEEENARRALAQRWTPAEIDAHTQARLKADHRPAMQTVDGKMRELVAAQEAEQLTGEQTFSNVPRAIWSFGALTSYAFRARTDRARVKVGNDGKLAADPLTRNLTMVVVNVVPWGYDDSKPFSGRGFIRPFAGVVAAPDFGVGVGASFTVWRGIGLNLGHAWLMVPALNDDDMLAEPPADPNDAFGRGTGKAWFVGASYNFPLK